jgi:hypothetical protein
MRNHKRLFGDLHLFGAIKWREVYEDVDSIEVA